MKFRLLISKILVMSSALGLLCSNLIYGGHILRTTQGIENNASAASALTPTATDRLQTQARIAQESILNSRRNLAALRQSLSAARSAALAGPNRLGDSLIEVPNGLTAGGLEVGSQPWVGARLKSQTDALLVDVEQTSASASLYWETFNVGKETTLNFDQSLGGVDAEKWIAYNIIEDASEQPSQILGSITAQGQVYVLNPNGVLFGGSSQVNLRGLTVSSLPINDNLVENGLLNNPDVQFLFSAFDQAEGINGTPAFTAPAPPSSGQYGDVIVQAGALLETTVSDENVGGRVFLVGANVINEGTISTPFGQTILASGLQVGVLPHDTDDASLRGLDVYIGKVAADGTAVEDIYAGDVINRGVIEASMGNITLAGRSIEQNAFLESGTSVEFNGRIDLLASYDAISNSSQSASQRRFVPQQTGSILLGSDSAMNILPFVDGNTVTDTALALRSQVNLLGKTIYFGAGSSLLAPNAIVNVDAGVWRTTGAGTSLIAEFVYGDGQIYLDTNSVIDVSGTTEVSIPIEREIVTLELRGTEFADSPLQREGPLRGESVTVDLRKSGTYQGVEWVGSPIANLSPYLNLIERDINELTLQGGDVNLRSGGSIIQRLGSKIDVSGGWISYSSGFVNSTQLVSDGRLINIEEALPDVEYEGIYSNQSMELSTRWDQERVFNKPLQEYGRGVFEEGYTWGADGGSVSMQAASMVLNGELIGKTFTSARQRESNQWAQGSTLSLTFQKQDIDNPFGDTYQIVSPTAPNILLQEKTLGAPGDFAMDINGDATALTSDFTSTFELSPDILNEDGFRNVLIRNTEGDITLPLGSNVEGRLGGSLELHAANINISGNISIPTGSIRLNAYTISQEIKNSQDRGELTANPAFDPSRGNITIGENVSLDTSGLLVNELGIDSENDLPLIAVDGGNIAISGYNVSIADGTIIEASGSAIIDTEGDINYGDAGTISIISGREDYDNISFYEGDLSINLNEVLLESFSGNTLGGDLILQASHIQIGGSDVASGGILLENDFFSQGGFSQFDLAGIGLRDGSGNMTAGVLVDSAADIQPQTEAILLNPNEGLVYDTKVHSPVTLNIVGLGADNGFSDETVILADVTVEAGSNIQLDAQSSFSAEANVVKIDGNISAPAGSISIVAGNEYDLDTDSAANASPTLRLGSNASLLATGTTFLTQEIPGVERGVLLDGGEVSLSGNLLLEAGALIDVSGASGEVALTPFEREANPVLEGIEGSSDFELRTLYSDGGSIQLEGGELLVSAANLQAASGGGDAKGGRIEVDSGRFYLTTDTQFDADVTLTVQQSGSLYQNSNLGVGQAVVNADGDVIVGGGFINADALQNSGAAHLALGGSVLFEGPVVLSTTGSIEIADSGVITADDQVLVQAPYIKLGQDFRTPLDPTQEVIYYSQSEPGKAPENHYFLPTSGAGNFQAQAELIDVGTLSFFTTNDVTLDAGTGSIRGNGFLNLAGNLNLEASQVYPTTASEFTITAFAPGGSSLSTVNIASSGEAVFPYSAVGSLNIYANQINQNGTLRAPYGSIELGTNQSVGTVTNRISNSTLPVTETLNLGASSLTSVSGIDSNGEAVSLPYGVVINGSQWIDPRGVDITQIGVAEKSILLSGNTVNTVEGSSVDLRGGGELFAYEYIEGLGGTSDILDNDNAFAIIPGYSSFYAPYAPFNDQPITDNLNDNNNPGELIEGYRNDNLAVGDQIVLGEGQDLPAGTYTLLPARYALLPDAFLITSYQLLSADAAPIGSSVLPDGLERVSGYQVNALGGAFSGNPVQESYLLYSAESVRDRSEFIDYTANAFLEEAAQRSEITVPRLPQDSGRLLFSANNELLIQGNVLAESIASGRGGLIDIDSSSDIYITDDLSKAPAGSLVLETSVINQFGSESLLIGGRRESTIGDSVVTTSTDNLTVDNPNSPVINDDLILVAKEGIDLKSGSVIQSSDNTSSAAQNIFIGDEGTVGDGVLVRVSSSQAEVVRSATTGSTTPSLTIGDNVLLSGTSITIDSSSNSEISASAVITSNSLALNAGQTQILLDDSLIPSSANALTIGEDLLAGIFENSTNLTLLSYSTIDIYGSGQLGTSEFASLTLDAPALRGFDVGGGDVDVLAQTISVENSNTDFSISSSGPSTGNIHFISNDFQIGQGLHSIQQFDTVTVEAASTVEVSGEGGLWVDGDVIMDTPQILAKSSSDQRIEATGELSIASSAATAEGTTSNEIGAKLLLQGSAVDINTNIDLRSGYLTVKAENGDITIGDLQNTNLDVSGTSQTFFDLTRYTDAGSIELTAQGGDVIVGDKTTFDLSADSDAGRAGELSISAGEGTLLQEGSINATGHEGGRFVLDVNTFSNTDLADLESDLTQGGVNQSRALRIRQGDITVSHDVASKEYQLSTDQGDITIQSTLDASGTTGGLIALQASGDLIIDNGAVLSVAAEQFDNAGKGGSVYLAAGSTVDGVVDSSATLDIRAGSTIDLSVAEETSNSAYEGKFSGTLHLRAPQNATGTDVHVNAIAGDVIGGSHIAVEGYQLYDLTGTDGTITSAVQDQIKNDGSTFLDDTVNYNAMRSRLLSANNSLDSRLFILPGAEVINRSGDLILGSSTSTTSSDWNLEEYRYGPNQTPGVLTLRASEDLVFYNALSDGFTVKEDKFYDPFSGAFTSNPVDSLWLAPLMDYNPDLPLNLQSWDFRLTAGADLGASDFQEILAADTLNPEKGSLLLGKDAGQARVAGGADAQTDDIIDDLFQVIRTGSGDITINTGEDLQLLNPFASIYTAGTEIADFTTVASNNDFVIPFTQTFAGIGINLNQGGLGIAQQEYPAQYSVAGGNVHIHAQGDIARYTEDSSGNQVLDTSRQLPNNWLMRRGRIDSDTGEFGEVIADFGFFELPVNASTTWWVDFSNFFQGVGALGGGNVTMLSDQDILNVDAVIPTNARMPMGTPDSAAILELGGGDLWVEAKGDISGGTYYVERGQGNLIAQDSITTNFARSPSLGIVQSVSSPDVAPELSWLATTLFLGKGGFNVEARQDLLIGSTNNTFLLPQGLNNRTWHKTYFSTYDETSSLQVSSLTGDITVRQEVTLSDSSAAEPALLAWMNSQQLLSATGGANVADFQPWIRSLESSVTPFETVYSLLPSEVMLTSFSGNISLNGDLNLFPSPTGTLELVAGESVLGLQPSGTSSSRSFESPNTTVLTSTTINVSDTSPSNIRGIDNPFAYANVVGDSAGDLSITGSQVLSTVVDQFFAETGETDVDVSTQQALHDPDLLHADDDQPIYIYAHNGDISGLTLFAPKESKIVAQRDITDIEFYLTNAQADDYSVVASGRDIIAYNANSELRVQASSAGFGLDQNTSEPLSGNIQIGGSGTLEVLAGRDLELGISPDEGDTETRRGITSVGNQRNTALPDEGADITIASGIGSSYGLANSNLDIDAFVDSFLAGGSLADRYLAELATLLDTSSDQALQAFEELTSNEQAKLVIDIFYFVLRDAGRDYNDPDSQFYLDYSNGFAAIETLFPDGLFTNEGSIDLTSRTVNTAEGGDIRIISPQGGVLVGSAVAGDEPNQGIITESGGNIHIFTDLDVEVGISRIFTLRGGNIIIWSSSGDIAAGSAAKTVQSAPPTRVIFDSVFGTVETDLAGLSTGGGIGTLETVEGVEPSDIDLIAPTGVIDAGDAGIRSSGNLNIAAVEVLNASNISVTGSSSGVPATPTVSAPNISTIVATSATGSASTNAASASQATSSGGQAIENTISVVTVQVVGYGGSDPTEQSEEDEEGI